MYFDSLMHRFCVLRKSKRRWLWLLITNFRNFSVSFQILHFEDFSVISVVKDFQFFLMPVIEDFSVSPLYCVITVLIENVRCHPYSCLYRRTFSFTLLMSSLSLLSWELERGTMCRKVRENRICWCKYEMPVERWKSFTRSAPVPFVLLVHHCLPLMKPYSRFPSRLHLLIVQLIDAKFRNCRLFNRGCAKVTLRGGGDEDWEKVLVFFNYKMLILRSKKKE